MTGSHLRTIQVADSAGALHPVAIVASLGGPVAIDCGAFLVVEADGDEGARLLAAALLAARPASPAAVTP